MNVCMQACMYVYTYIHRDTHVWIHKPPDMHTNMHVSRHARTHARMCGQTVHAHTVNKQPNVCISVMLASYMYADPPPLQPTYIYTCSNTHTQTSTPALYTALCRHAHAYSK